jgi:hypothetical protein
MNNSSAPDTAQPGESSKATTGAAAPKPAMPSARATARAAAKTAAKTAVKARAKPPTKSASKATSKKGATTARKSAPKSVSAAAAKVKRKPTAKPTSKAPIKATRKPAGKLAAGHKPTKKGDDAKADKKAKSKKTKLVRDSFTIPEAEYNLIAAVKKRCLTKGLGVKKTEVLRAAIISFAAQSDATVTAALKAVEILKTGRPPNA